LLIRLAGLTKLGNPSIRQLAGIITPELLAKETISSRFGRATTVELLTRLGLAHVIDQGVYRKALAIALRRDEGMSRQSEVDTESEMKRMISIIMLNYAHYRRLIKNHIDYIRDNPSILTFQPTRDSFCLIEPLIVMGNSQGIRQLTDAGIITPEILTKSFYELGPREEPTTALDVINSFHNNSGAALIDPVVYRKAMAMHLRKEESGAKSAINQLTRS
jgi:hypothetical protein